MSFLSLKTTVQTDALRHVQRCRTRWLRVPYRNARQIFRAAYALIADNPVAQRLLAECGERIQPDLACTAMRDGPRPQVHRFSS
jgi:hypothetical protein